ncbi:MAG: hypothetical protein JWP79_1064 [Polaromonas sp.]|nr:hypothetical protein [Polaromonas sp.]
MVCQANQREGFTVSITSVLAKRFSNYDNQQSVGSKLRTKRIAPLLEMIDEVYKKYGSVSVIDIGGSEQYWGIVPLHYLTERNVKITVVNLPGSRLPQDHGPFSFVESDGCDLARFADRSFHIAHSNSVLEHVGDWRRKVQFVKELERVSQAYFVQTPNYWFPIEPHFMTPFFHWLPPPARIWLVRHFRLGHFEIAESIGDAVVLVEHAGLVTDAMFRYLFKDARILTERFFWLPKSFIALKK